MFELLPYFVLPVLVEQLIFCHLQDTSNDALLRAHCLSSVQHSPGPLRDGREVLILEVAATAGAATEVLPSVALPSDSSHWNIKNNNCIH